MQLRRASQRFDVREEGRVIFADGSCALDCVIRDISDGGCRVECSLEMPLPERVFLALAQTADVFDCGVRWQIGKVAGLQFIDICGRQLRRALVGAEKPAAPARPSRVTRWLADCNPSDSGSRIATAIDGRRHGTSR
jgi:hypothetical protein